MPLMCKVIIKFMRVWRSNLFVKSSSRLSKMRIFSSASDGGGGVGGGGGDIVGGSSWLATSFQTHPTRLAVTK